MVDQINHLISLGYTNLGGCEALGVVPRTYRYWMDNIVSICSGIINNNNSDENDDEFASTNQDMARKSLAFKSQILEMQAAFTAVEECSVPVVASIHGACVGAGIDLICCADVRVCDPNAKFSIREVRLGLAADVGTLQRFPKIVGYGSLVRELCLTGGKHSLIVMSPFFLHTFASQLKIINEHHQSYHACYVVR